MALFLLLLKAIHFDFWGFPFLPKSRFSSVLYPESVAWSIHPGTLPPFSIFFFLRPLPLLLLAVEINHFLLFLMHFTIPRIDALTKSSCFFSWHIEAVYIISRLWLRQSVVVEVTVLNHPWMSSWPGVFQFFLFSFVKLFVGLRLEAFFKSLRFFFHVIYQFGLSAIFLLCLYLDPEKFCLFCMRFFACFYAFPEDLLLEFSLILFEDSVLFLLLGYVMVSF